VTYFDSKNERRASARNIFDGAVCIESIDIWFCNRYITISKF